MKVTNTRGSDFRPYTLSITVETQEEHAALATLSGTNATVSRAAYAVNFSSKQERLRDMLGKIYTKL